MSHYTGTPTVKARRLVSRCIRDGDGIYHEISHLGIDEQFAIIAGDDEIKAYIAAHLLCEDLEQLTIDQLETLAEACSNWYKASTLLNTARDKLPAYWFLLMRKSEAQYTIAMQIDSHYDDGYTMDIDGARYDNRKDEQYEQTH